MLHPSVRARFGKGHVRKYLIRSSFINLPACWTSTLGGPIWLSDFEGEDHFTLKGNCSHEIFMQ